MESYNKASPRRESFGILIQVQLTKTQVLLKVAIIGLDLGEIANDLGVGRLKGEGVAESFGRFNVETLLARENCEHVPADKALDVVTKAEANEGPSLLLLATSRVIKGKTFQRKSLSMIGVGLKDGVSGLATLDSFLKATPDSFKDPVDSTEILLYKNMLLEETGNIQGALDQLVADEAKIFDKEALQTKKAEFLRKLGRRNEAEAVLLHLIKVNPDNYNHYQALFLTLELIPETLTSLRTSAKIEKVAELVALCDELAKTFPKARAPLLIPLSFVSGDDFKKRFGRAVADPLTKGTPSLFASLKYLYADKEKAKIAGEVMAEIEKNVLANAKLSAEETLTEPPSTILWIRYYLAQHASFMSEPQKALAYLDQCIAHTPTCLEFELMKGRVYKDHGDIAEAILHVEEARSMDLADRYLNNKATRYLLRGGKIEEGRKLISIYTKAVPSEMVTEYNNVYDLQVNWYAIEEGDAWRNAGNLAMALKRYNDVDEHFTQYFVDEFDYHAYCLRKNTLRAYVQTIKYHDRVRDHPFWFRAATKAVETYLELIDSPPKVAETVDKELEGLSDAERKKVLAKRRKAAAQKEREEEEKRKTNQQSISSKKRQGHYDADPEGLQFLAGKDYLAEADKLAKALVQNCPDKLQSHLLAFEVAFRRAKYLQALKALKKSIALATVAHPDVHFNIVRLANKLPALSGSLNEHVLALITESVSSLGASNVAKFNVDYLSKNSSSLLARLAYARASAHIGQPVTPSEAEAFIKEGPKLAQDFKELIAVHKFLTSHSLHALAADLKKASAERFPIAAFFKAPV